VGALGILLISRVVSELDELPSDLHKDVRRVKVHKESHAHRIIWLHTLEGGGRGGGEEADGKKEERRIQGEYKKVGGKDGTRTIKSRTNE